MADTDVASEPVFRASKRRKVFRRQRNSEVEEDADIKSEGVGNGNRELASEAVEHGDDSEGSALRFQKRAGVRKHGIGFSSTGGRGAAQQQENEETALVTGSQDVAQEMQNDRFVRPTGREVVTEDKHMYVRAKSNKILRKDSTNSVGWHT